MIGLARGLPPWNMEKRVEFCSRRSVPPKPRRLRLGAPSPWLILHAVHLEAAQLRHHRLPGRGRMAESKADGWPIQQSLFHNVRKSSSQTRFPPGVVPRKPAVRNWLAFRRQTSWLR